MQTVERTRAGDASLIRWEAEGVPTTGSMRGRPNQGALGVGRLASARRCETGHSRGSPERRTSGNPKTPKKGKCHFADHRVSSTLRHKPLDCPRGLTLGGAIRTDVGCACGPAGLGQLSLFGGSNVRAVSISGSGVSGARVHWDQGDDSPGKARVS